MKITIDLQTENAEEIAEILRDIADAIGAGYMEGSNPEWSLDLK